MELDKLTEHPFEIVHAGEPPRATGTLYGVPGGNVRSISRCAECMPSSLITGPRRCKNHETSGEIFPLRAAIDNCVDHAVSVEKLGRVRSFKQFLTDDLLRYARTREADQSPRFGQDDIPQIGERREY